MRLDRIWELQGMHRIRAITLLKGRQGGINYLEVKVRIDDSSRIISAPERVATSCYEKNLDSKCSVIACI